MTTLFGSGRNGARLRRGCPRGQVLMVCRDSGRRSLLRCEKKAPAMANTERGRTRICQQAQQQTMTPSSAFLLSRDPADVHGLAIGSARSKKKGSRPTASREATQLPRQARVKKHRRLGAPCKTARSNGGEQAQRLLTDSTLTPSARGARCKLIRSEAGTKPGLTSIVIKNTRQHAMLK